MGYKERINNVIAQSCTTYSKRYDQYLEGVTPWYVEHQNGDWFYTQEESVMDFTGALGATNSRAGNISGIPFLKEVQVAEMLKERIPCLEKMKFLKTGSEACLAAVRIARAHTGRSMVYGVGYHGWGDMFINAENPGAGTIDGKYKKFDNLELLIEGLGKALTVLRRSDECTPAAVIIEPVMVEEDTRVSVNIIRALCNDLGAVLIFDEVITGFRFPEYCVANLFEVQPDIMCLGKTLADGFPLSVVGGKAEMMDNPDYFVSSTFAGELSALEAAEKTIQLNTKEVLHGLWMRGELFFDKLNGILTGFCLVGYPTRTVWKGNKDKIYLFWQEMRKRGYLLGKSFFYNHLVDRNAKTFLRHAKLAVEDMKGKKFNGKRPKPAFRKEVG